MKIINKIIAKYNAIKIKKLEKQAMLVIKVK